LVDSLREGLELLKSHTVLEIGAGTSNYSHALSRAGFALVSLDVSAPMLEKASLKAATCRIQGDAMALPLKSSSIDAAIGVNVLRHLSEVEKALREMRRVCRRGAVVQAVLHENLETLWYRHYFPEIDEVLLPLHPTLGFMMTALLRAGFVRVHSAPLFYSGEADLTFESARQHPELLFDADFRAATSGFRRLSPRGIENGLDRLRCDLESGAFSGVAERFEQRHGATGDCFVLRAVAG
jgi:ubiquinone/menaquinone biosynthesis C-methylase UbiE